MKKALLGLATASAIAGLLAASVSSADARWRRGGYVAAGVVGGLAAGAIIGSAYAYPRAYYPVVGYEPYPVYYAPPAYRCPGGYWARRPMYDRFGNVVGYTRPRFFCPAY